MMAKRVLVDAEIPLEILPGSSALLVVYIPQLARKPSSIPPVLPGVVPGVASAMN
jgi:hypothetical protein